MHATKAVSSPERQHAIKDIFAKIHFHCYYYFSAIQGISHLLVYKDSGVLFLLYFDKKSFIYYYWLYSSYCDFLFSGRKQLALIHHMKFYISLHFTLVHGMEGNGHIQGTFLWYTYATCI